MAVELAVALAAIAARAVVAGLIRGQPMDNEDWAGVGTQVVDALITTSKQQAAEQQHIGRQFDVLVKKVDHVGQQIDDIPGREFAEHMAAGRRYLRDLPDSWRSSKDRRTLIRDARHEFVRAFGIAEHMKSPQRQALADVAIAGCWLWVPSLPDVQKTAGAALQLLEHEMLYGTTLPTQSYADVLHLCKTYGEQPASVEKPILPKAGQPPTAGARLAVYAGTGRWARCADIEMRIDLTPDAAADSEPRRAAPGGLLLPGVALGRDNALERYAALAAAIATRRVQVQVRNTRSEWISISTTRYAVIARLPNANNTLPTDNRVSPGSTATFDLPRPPVAVGPLNAPAIPKIPAIGFLHSEAPNPPPALGRFWRT